MALPLPHIKMSCVSLHTKFSLFNLIYSPAIHSLVHCWMCWARQWSMPLSVLLQKFFQRLALTWRSERMQTCAIFFAHFIALHAAKHLSVHTRRPWGSMRPRKLRLLQGSTSMDIIGLKHKSTNQIKRLTHSPCDERWMQKLTLCTGASGRHKTVWRNIQGLNTHVLGPTQSDRLRRESSKNSLITTQYEKKKEIAGLACSLGLREVLWEERSGGVDLW